MGNATRGTTQLPLHLRWQNRLHRKSMGNSPPQWIKNEWTRYHWRTSLPSQRSILNGYLGSSKLSIVSLYQLNLCRLYLRVSKLSDIVSNDGKHIQYAFLAGTRINTYTNLEWLRQSKPSEDVWKFWKNLEKGIKPKWKFETNSNFDVLENTQK